jgi:hypothetical protein
MRKKSIQTGIYLGAYGTLLYLIKDYPAHCMMNDPEEYPLMKEMTDKIDLVFPAKCVHVNNGAVPFDGYATISGCKFHFDDSGHLFADGKKVTLRNQTQIFSSYEKYNLAGNKITARIIHMVNQCLIILH